MQQKNSFIVYVLLIQLLSLFPSNEFKQVHNNKSHHVEMHVDNHHNVGRSNSVELSACYIKTPDIPHRCLANYSIIAHQGSQQLKQHFNTVITPLLYSAAIQNHYHAIPGYESSHGLRDCFVQASQFPSSDAMTIKHLNDRLEVYCERIEAILFSGKHSAFVHALSHKAKTELVEIYADFLKEFYSGDAPFVFYNQSQKSPLMERTMRDIDWRWYDDSNYARDKRMLEQRYAAALNGSLGAVHKALEMGDVVKAYSIGQQKVRTVFPGRCVGKTEKIISVFEAYPDVHKTVEQRYLADKAKVAQELQVKQAAMHQEACVLQEKCNERVSYTEWELRRDLLLQRYAAAERDDIHAQFYQKLHNLLPEQATCIDSQHLTADKKGMLISGCHLQHQLADEAVSVVDTVISCDLTGNMHDAVVDLANASLACNKEGHVVTASSALDACWMLIDFTQKAARYAHSSLSVNVPIVAAMLDGVGESLSGAAHAVCHPIETVQDVVQSFVVAGYYVGKLTYAIAEHSAVCDMVEMYPERAEQMIKEHLIDPELFSIVYEQAQNISTQDVARVGTKTAVDMMLLHGATKVVSAIAKESLPAFLSCMRKGAQSSEVAMTAEGVPVRCAEEVASLMSNMEKAGGGAAAKVITESRMFIETMASNLLSEVKLEIAVLKEKFACVQNCIPDCAKKGFAEFKNGHIKIPYEHIFGIEFKWNDVKNTLSGISGFHHDFMGSIEKSGLLKFVRKAVEKNGCYLADVIVDGSRVPGKTFFPQHWSREKVISKIYEAYENFVKNGATAYVERHGKYVFQGMTKEGIKIEMYITKNGQIATAYPIVELGVEI